MTNGWDQADVDPAYVDFAAHADELDAVHPCWYHLASSTTLTTIYGEGSHTILDHTTAAGKRTLLIPMVAAVDGAEPGWIATMIHDANLRQQHIQTLVDLATSKGYDGLDLDYEHLTDADRAAFSQFAAELATAMHAKGKVLSFALEPSLTVGPHDWVALSAVADQLHVMGYDFHFLGSHPGPIAPLGWVKQLIAFAGGIAGGTRTQKFILGIPNYGLAGPTDGVTGWAGNTQQALALLGGASYATTTDHMLTCPFGDIDPGRAPNAMTSQGQLFFDDVLSLEEKVQAAQNGHFGGITIWGIGGEPTEPTRTLFQMIRQHYPQ
jgi:spore germination protein YaaH